MRRQTDHAIVSQGHGWTSSSGSGHHRRLNRRLGTFLLLLPLLIGLVGAPAAPQVQGDELSDARARQAQLKKQAADQKAEIAKLNDLQAGLSAEIKQTSTELRGIGADLAVVKVKITSMQTAINKVRTQYNNLVTQLDQLNAQLLDIQRQEDAKTAELAQRKALLAQRVRAAYDTDRVSLLESFLSGGTFADLLTEMNYYIDIGEQDKALAMQIVRDQDTLAALHQSVLDTQAQTEELRVETAAQKKTLDKSMADLKKARAQLKVLEAATARALARQKAAYSAVLHNKAAARRALAKAAAAQRSLQADINEIIRKAASTGRIPSQYNGTLAWPMVGTVTQNFGCTGFSWEPPLGSCAHYHSGIDIVAPEGTPVHSSGAGTVAYCGWNYADGTDPAWIVIVAHSAGLETWYAHMQPSCPAPTGSHVNKGEIVGHEGNTGHSTGAHLHWAVRQNGTFMNPRLFL
jgi:murein DD-endopeptidase MepM/ murein hydrolase activator NlpD